MALVKIVAVEPKAPYTVKFVLADGRHRQVDLTGLVHTSQHFRRFAEDKTAFKDVRVTRYGSGIEWSNGLDLSVETLNIMADEQREMSGQEFAKFLGKLNVNIEEAAHILDVSTRTIRSYKNAKRVPRTYAVTLRRCAQDHAVFAALYRPIAVNPRGRPKSALRH